MKQVRIGYLKFILYVLGVGEKRWARREDEEDNRKFGEDETRAGRSRE